MAMNMAGSAGGGGGRRGRRRAAVMAEINVTPMVDVMLVLLIIFMITAPLITHKIQIDLPQAAATKNPDKPDIVTLSIDAQGKMYWNDQAVTDDEWKVRVRSAALKNPQPELHLRAEKTTQYQKLLGYIRTAGFKANIVIVPDQGS